MVGDKNIQPRLDRLEANIMVHNSKKKRDGKGESERGREGGREGGREENIAAEGGVSRRHQTGKQKGSFEYKVVPVKVRN